MMSPDQHNHDDHDDQETSFSCLHWVPDQPQIAKFFNRKLINFNDDFHIFDNDDIDENSDGDDDRNTMSCCRILCPGGKFLFLVRTPG